MNAAHTATRGNQQYTGIGRPEGRNVMYSRSVTAAAQMKMTGGTKYFNQFAKIVLWSLVHLYKRFTSVQLSKSIKSTFLEEEKEQIHSKLARALLYDHHPNAAVIPKELHT